MSIYIDRSSMSRQPHHLQVSSTMYMSSPSLDRSTMSSQTPRSSASFSPTYGKSSSMTHLSEISTLSASSSFSSSSSLFGSVKRSGSSGPLKSFSKSYATILIPSAAVGKKKLSISEPVSPHVTCLGRIRIKEPGSSFANWKDVHKSAEDCTVATSHPRERGSNNCKSNSKSKTSEEVGCFSGRMRRSSGKDALILEQSQIVLRRFSSSVNVETRRDRGRPLTSFLEKPRLQKEATNDMEMQQQQQEYIPAVPPPNSLLLMRDMKRKENLETGDHPHVRMHLRTTISDESNNKARNSFSSKRVSASSSREIKPVANNAVSHDLLSSQEQEEVEKTVAEALSRRKDLAPFSERENNTIQGDAAEKCTENCRAPSTDYIPSGLALWQRRAIAELSAIDVRRGNQIPAAAAGMRGAQPIPLIGSS